MLHATYSLTAAMIRRDGTIDSCELETAERIGGELFAGFDAGELREYCRNPSRHMSVIQLCETMRDRLDDDHKRQIIKLLSAIAACDADPTTEERELLDTIATAIGIGR